MFLTRLIARRSSLKPRRHTAKTLHSACRATIELLPERLLMSTTYNVPTAIPGSSTAITDVTLKPDSVDFPSLGYQNLISAGWFELAATST